MESIDVQPYSALSDVSLIGDTVKVPLLVPIPNVPNYLGHISRSKVYRLVAEGELTRVRIGSRAFISGESITALLGKVLSSGNAA